MASPLLRKWHFQNHKYSFSIVPISFLLLLISLNLSVKWYYNYMQPMRSSNCVIWAFQLIWITCMTYFLLLPANGRCIKYTSHTIFNGMPISVLGERNLFSMKLILIDSNLIFKSIACDLWFTCIWLLYSSIASSIKGHQRIVAK